MPSRAWHEGTLPVSAVVDIRASVGIACPMPRQTSPGFYAMKQRHWCSRVRLAVRRGMCMPSQTEALIEAINVELEAGNWSQVVALTTELYACAVVVGDMQFAELIQDLHWIANDALLHPIDVAALVSP